MFFTTQNDTSQNENDPIQNPIHSKIIYIKVANIAFFLDKSCGSRNFLQKSLLKRKQSCDFSNSFLKIFDFFEKFDYIFVT